MAQASFADSKTGVKKWNRTSGGETAAEWKIQDFGKFRVWKSYFQSFPDFFQNNFSEQTRMDHVSEWYESILEEKSQAWMITQLQI